ncbi:TMEM175 family protein [Amycolatopsis sp. NPDC051371]|uniref:TMEM175 family protein n=1 Tax=Amycolatopsis sp. NPDC051371 TaxID=3155800 RepID=UPI00344904EA
MEQKSSERLVFFTDAVVAIALTLLVLPLTELVPELVAEHKPALEVVTGNWSKIFSFVLSFVVIGRFWSVHHTIFEHVRSYSTALLRTNFCWLLTIAVLPFPTELIGAYQTERFTVVFYLGTLLASSLCHTALVLIVRRDPQVRGDAEPMSDESFWSFAVSTAVFALAVVVGLIKPGFGYYVLLLLALPSTIVRRVLGRGK